MKKIAIALLLLASTITYGQEKVKLRVKYKKGDTYQTHLVLNQDMGLMKMDVEMKMNMLVGEKKGNSHDTKSNFVYVATDVDQGGQKVSYNSNMNEAELTPMAKQFAATMSPMLKTTFYVNIDDLGKSKIIKLEPKNEGALKMQDQMNAVVFPEEAVSVGYSWVKTQKSNNVEMELTYTITVITKSEVKASIKGKMSSLPDAKIWGSLSIDRKTGVTTNTKLNMEFETMGQKMKSTTDIKVSKI
ncbi:hypothetical protein ACOSP6_15655 [Tenacibaculum sp. MEBiC06402]|uniref:hypothetical protein n=1 Tax=unclassified Tenacibaculum TaxID=2635139 RepID=UPI003B9B02EB